MPEISDTITTIATDGVQKASVDGRSVEAPPIPDIIAGDNHVASRAGAPGNRRGIRITKFFKGGHTDDAYGGRE